MLNLSKRVYDHSFHIDPIVRTLMDTDFYKFLMLQFIWERYRNVQVTFSVINRTKSVKLADEVDETLLRAQLDHAKNLRFTKSELIWLQGNTFYGTRGIFKPEFIEWLRTFKLPDYHLEKKDGQYELTFGGTWPESSVWEIPALAIINEMRNRTAMAKMSKFELDIMYSRATARLWDKLNSIKPHLPMGIADFGTRRRHGYLWQEKAIEMAADVLGKSFLGTSNVHLAMKHDLEAIGTNAHELPMVLAALSKNVVELANAQYEVLEGWQEMYDGALLIMLPDTFGTTQFLKNAPEWVANWTGIRIDSKNPFEGGEEIIRWWRGKGKNPLEKRILFSDGLDAKDIIELHERFKGEVRDGYGWGTLLTNDFRGCHPRDVGDLNPISLVCKVKSANGNPAVKLSDNYEKATGPLDMVEKYRGVFGLEGIANAPVIV